MTQHNPYANASNGQPPWSQEEDAAILAFRAQGLSPLEIHMKMPKRTAAAIKNRLTTLRVGRDIIRKRQRERRKSQRKEYTINHVVEPRIVVPDEVLADRDRRNAARDLDSVGAMLGDPPRGFSALEGRR